MDDDDERTEVTVPDWRDALAVRPADLADATVELHWAVQLLASAGQTFAEPQDDDSHRAMTWSTELGAFVGADFAGPYPFRLALRPADLTLLLLDRQDETLSAFELPARSREQAYEWLGIGMATYRGGGLPLIERPGYDMPEHAVGGTGRFAVDRAEERATLSALYGSAARTLQAIFGDRKEASPVRCWPHHFDIATLITVEVSDDGEATRTIGVGMAPMGGGYTSWYLYVTPWPYPEPRRLPTLGGDGHWHTERWTGAVLTGDEVRAFTESDPEARIRRFLRTATASARAALG